MEFDIYDGTDFWGKKEFDTEIECYDWCQKNNLRFIRVRKFKG